MQRSLRSVCISLAAAVLAVVAIGCGDDADGDAASGAATGAGTGTATASSGQEQRIADMVPEEIKEDGVLTVASDTAFPPLEFYDENGKHVGVDIEISQALGEAMGLEVKNVGSKFDAILPGLETGDFEMAMSWFNSREDREELFDMVRYAKSGNTYYAGVDFDESKLQELEDLCPLRYAVLKGSSQAAAAEELNTDVCDGKLQVMQFPDQNAMALALVSGRADVANANGPLATYMVEKSEGGLKVLEALAEDPHPIAIAVPKEPGLSAAVLEAVKEIMANGTYGEILEKWGIAEHAAITKPVINGTTDGIPVE